MLKRTLYIQFFLNVFLFATGLFAQNPPPSPSHPLPTTHPDSDAPCISCHHVDEPHSGAFGRNCSLCHATKSWNQPFFDHGLSPFPLIGLHSEIDCDGCHAEEPGKSGLRTCRDCHLEDDPHELKLGDNCAHCHNPNGWGYWQFDHNTQTAFTLEGAHIGLTCTACHITPVTDHFNMPQDCADCHQKDDRHRGEFGFNCERCHQPTGFNDVKVP